MPPRLSPVGPTRDADAQPAGFGVVSQAADQHRPVRPVARVHSGQRTLVVTFHCLFLVFSLPFAAFPCVFTAFPCVSLPFAALPCVFHCLSLPFTAFPCVFSLPFTA